MICPRALALGCLLSLLPTASAEELSKDDVAFLKSHAPRLLAIIRDAEKNDFEEVLDEGFEWVERLREEWDEAKGDGIPWAKLMVDGMANEAAVEYLWWKLEEGAQVWWNVDLNVHCGFCFLRVEFQPKIRVNLGCYEQGGKEEHFWWFC